MLRSVWRLLVVVVGGLFHISCNHIVWHNRNTSNVNEDDIIHNCCNCDCNSTLNALYCIILWGIEPNQRICVGFALSIMTNAFTN